MKKFLLIKDKNVLKLQKWSLKIYTGEIKNKKIASTVRKK